MSIRRAPLRGGKRPYDFHCLMNSLLGSDHPSWAPVGRGAPSSGLGAPGLAQHVRGRNPIDYIQTEGHHLAPKLPVTPASRSGVRQRQSEIRSRGNHQLSITPLPRAIIISCCLLCRFLGEGTTERGLCCPAPPRGRYIPPSKEQREKPQIDHLNQLLGISVWINEKAHNDLILSFSDVPIEIFCVWCVRFFSFLCYPRTKEYCPHIKQ